ncbi:hypothetical protein BS47DRAFT_1420393 [Hydnum rufescens UP504]|uniref:DNA 3'-5' helicase n=1 Tax=Hydnum rufescens UP504 TaxID=1448309 RepID=A0A9P6B7H7_9AGAM|nr:hypothetical protein BS47DRAFT_1420393 [Hydnum rufescens UP504]
MENFQSPPDQDCTSDALGTPLGQRLGQCLLDADVYLSFPKEYQHIICDAVEWVHSRSTIKPRQDQLEALVTLIGHKLDLVYVAATGSGKTLIIAMWMLLNPDKYVVTISPLKELQRGQVLDLEKFGLKSLAINKEMTCNLAFWGPAELLKGHGPFNALLHNPAFRDHVGLFVVDEAHNIDRWGLPHGNSPAFQPQWGQLGMALIQLFALPQSSIVFCDDWCLACKITRYLTHRLSPTLQKDGLIRSFHSGFSDEYCKKMWSDFVAGEVLMLIATSAARMGCNVPVTHNTYQIGLCTDLIDYQQRVGQICVLNGIALLLYEPWAIAPKAEHEAWMLIPKAHKVVALGWYCCDGKGCGLPGGKTAEETWPIIVSKKKPQPRTSHCPVAQRLPLQHIIEEWHLATHTEEKFGNILPVEVFIPDALIQSVAKLKFPISVDAIIPTLEQLSLPPNYIRSIFDLVHDFDNGGWQSISHGVQAVAVSRAVKNGVHSRQAVQEGMVALVPSRSDGEGKNGDAPAGDVSTGCSNAQGEQPEENTNVRAHSSAPIPPDMKPQHTTILRTRKASESETATNIPKHPRQGVASSLPPVPQGPSSYTLRQ